MRLIPREEKFFALLVQQVDIISQASRLLLEGVRAGNSRMEGAAREISTLEGRGDDLIHDVLTRLNKTFLTPLDPEDIHSLASHLDDVLDGIEESAHRLVSYRLEPIPPIVVEMATIIQSCSMALHAAFESLGNGRHKLLDHCIQINRLEGEADRLFRIALAELFEREKDPVRLVKYKEVLDVLEETTDRCEDVADVLQGVMIKNG
jgi:hypothetical protein